MFPTDEVRTHVYLRGSMFLSHYWRNSWYDRDPGVHSQPTTSSFFYLPMRSLVWKPCRVTAHTTCFLLSQASSGLVVSPTSGGNQRPRRTMSKKCLPTIWACIHAARATPAPVKCTRTWEPCHVTRRRTKTWRRASPRTRPTSVGVKAWDLCRTML